MNLLKIRLIILILNFFPISLIAEEYALCKPIENVIPQRPQLNVLTDDINKLNLWADDAYLDKNAGILKFNGNVTLQRENQTINAGKLTYYSAKDKIVAQNKVTLWDDEYVVQGEEVELYENNSGKAKDGLYWLLNRRGRGSAETFNKNSDKKFNTQQSTYTTCDKNNEIWRLDSEKTDIDFNTKIVKAENVTLRIKNIPILYTPYLSFSLDSTRKSGLLSPKFGNSESSGFEISLPYYWNIAPNYDATFTPHLLTKRGLMLETELRWLTANSKSKLEWEFLPNDNKFDEDRSFIKFQHIQKINNNLSADILYNETSDIHYFEDLGTNLQIVSTRHLEKHVNLNYLAGWFTSTLSMQKFQTLDTNPAARPYEHLPMLSFQTLFPERNKKFNFNLTGQLTRFARKNITENTVSNNRFHIEPSINFKFKNSYSFIKPKFTLLHTNYKLNDQNFTRTLGRFNTDAGLFFERSINLFNTDLLQTLEPRMFTTYTSYKDQSELPLFDTAKYNFSFGQLFRENSFSGLDRIDDSRHLTLALTSRLLDKSNGKENLRASIGKIFYFDDRKVNIIDEIDANSSSNFITELSTELSNNLSFYQTMEFEKQGANIVQNLLHLRYHPANDKIINLSYRFRDNELEQADISTYWSIKNKWGIIGRLNYSLNDNKPLESLIGLEYNSCCMALRAVARRYQENLAGDYGTGIFLQVELKGLAGIGGKKMTNFLQEQIYGFEDNF
jgi:LPS-assembly protein